VVEAVGPARADGAGQGPVPAVGDRVYTSGSLTGTYAEAASAGRPRASAAAATTFAAGAALGVPYATAYRALFQRGQARTGELVLIHGPAAASAWRRSSLRWRRA